MNNWGFCNIYFNKFEANNFDELFDFLDNQRIELKKPGSGKIIQVSPEGESEEITDPQLLIQTFKNQNFVDFKIWKNNVDFIFVHIKRLDSGISKVDFCFELFKGKELEQILQILQMFFKFKLASGNILAFIVDRLGESEDLDWEPFWDTLMLSPPFLPNIWPDLLILRKDYLNLSGFQRLVNLEVNEMQGYTSFKLLK